MIDDSGGGGYEPSRMDVMLEATLKGLCVVLGVGAAGFWVFLFLPVVYAAGGEPLPLVIASAGFIPAGLLGLFGAGFIVGKFMARWP